ncbi:hypothetical protein [Streptomyces klenkii]
MQNVLACWFSLDRSTITWAIHVLRSLLAQARLHHRDQLALTYPD